MIYADRVKFTTTSTGTGAVQEGSAVAPFRQLSAIAGANGRQFCYLIQNAGATEYEWGLGTYTSGTPGSFARNTVFGSSNGGALVNFSEGTKSVTVIDAAAFHGVLDGEMHGAITGGTGSALTANFYPQPFALRDFARVAIVLHADIQANATFNPNGLGAEPIMEQTQTGLQAVSAGRWKAGMMLVLRRYDEEWQVANGMAHDLVPNASETVKGLVERATMAEALAGADTERYVTPAHLAAIFGQGTNLADGATVTIPATGGGYFVLLGTTALSTVAIEGGNPARPAGFEVTFRFNAAKTVQHSSSLNLKDDTSWAASAGDILVLRYEGSGVWREIDRHLETTPPPVDPNRMLDVKVDTATSGVSLNGSFQDSGLEVSVTISEVTATVLLTATLGVEGNDEEIRFQWRRGDNDFGPDLGYTLQPSTGNHRRIVTLHIHDVPGSGTHVYKLRARKTGSGTATIVSQTGPSNDTAYLSALVVKPAA